MSDMRESGTVPNLEVRVLRDGVVVERELYESEDEARAVLDAWSEVDGVTVEIEDLSRRTGSGGVLDPQPWEVDAEDLVHDDAAYTDEEEER